VPHFPGGIGLARAEPQTAVIDDYPPKDAGQENTTTDPRGPADRSAEEGADSNENRQLLLLTVYCLLIVLASLGGGWLPHVIRLTHTRMEMMISLVGGLMLGIGLFHMLPHAVDELGSLERAIWWMMIGLLTMFFLLRAFHFHQHTPVDWTEGTEAQQHDHDHDDGCAVHERTHEHSHHHGHSHHLNWMGVAFGLALHTLIDGMALGASIRSDAGHGALWSLFGLQTFLAIVLHKPLDAVSIASLMAAGGWSAGWRHGVNVGFALMCPLGAGLFFLGVGRFAGDQHVFVGCALAFSAGVFLAISLGDLLPEMQFHSHNRARLSLMLLMGIALAYLIEQSHKHEDHKHQQGGNSHIRGE